jgi:hypothetical protein
LTAEAFSWLHLQYLIKWICNFLEVLTLDMDINTGGVDAGVSQQFLDAKNINPCFEKVGGKTVAKGMNCCRLIYLGFFLASLNTF